MPPTDRPALVEAPPELRRVARADYPLLPSSIDRAITGDPRLGNRFDVLGGGVLISPATASAPTRRRSGREKLHFLNPVPIRLIHDRWINKFTEPRASALVELKNHLEEPQ